MKRIIACLLVAAIAPALLTSCATARKQMTNNQLKSAKKPAWSLHATTDQMIVAVSPMRQTLQIISSETAILGAGISAIQNSRYRHQLEQALTNYNPREIFESKISQRLQETLPAMERVASLGSTAGHNSTQEVEALRFKSLSKTHDVVLDLNMTFGLFGYEGSLIAKLDGDLNELPSGHALWRDAIMVNSSPVLASDKFTDPTNRLSPNFRSPRLSIEEGAINQWTKDDGTTLHKRFEASVDGAVSALLTELGLADEPVGNYYLGRQAMNRKKFDDAAAYYEKALKQDPNLVDARDALSVNLAYNRQLDDAIKIAKDIVAQHPDYAPANYNLAWWYAVKKKDGKAARPYYEKALALGMPKEKKIEKNL